MSFVRRAFGPHAHVVPLVIRISLGVVFVIAGVLKLNHAADLAATITGLRLGLPGPLVAVIAVALPPFEILLGLYLLAGWLLPVTSTVTVGLLLAFIAVLSSAVLRGLSTPCGCFGTGDSAPTTWLTVLRDGAMIVPAIYLWWWSRARKAL